MERRMHLIEPASVVTLKWPSIAAASTELRRPRHLHAVRSAEATPAPTDRAPRFGSTSSLARGRR
jgi:hypothetical protein